LITPGKAESDVLLTIVDIVLKASVILSMAGLVAFALRRASASTRHFVWTLGMVGALAAPVLSAALPRWEVPIVRVQPEAIVNPAGTLAAAPATPAPALHHRQTLPAAAAEKEVAAGANHPVTRVSQLPFTSVPWTTILLMAWAAGAVLILGRVALGVIAVQWMSRRTPLVADASWLPLAHELARELGLRRVRFMRAGHAAMPMAWGVFRPSVLMPSDADVWPAERLRIVLLHELAHVKRRDCLTHLFTQIAFAAYWFNPLAWIAARRLRTERERACDDLVLAAGTRGSDYADQLLDIARVMRAGRFPAVLAGASLAMARRSQLEGRLMAILDPTVPRRTLSRLRAGLVVATFAALVVPVAAVQPWTLEPDGQQGAPGQQSDPVIVKTDRRVERKAEQRTPRVVVKPGHPMADDGVAGGIANGIAGGVAGGVSEGVLSSVTEAIAGTHMVPMPMPMPAPMPMPLQEGAGAKAERNPKAVDALIEALKDTDADVRQTAMAALTRVRDPRLFDAFAAALRDPNADVRERAAFGLGQMHDKRAVAPLTQSLKDEKADVREQAVFALGQLRATEAIDALTLALRDSAADVREQAAFALGQIRDPRSVDPLTSALKDEKADVREQAAFALGQLRSSTAVEALVVALKDANAGVREQVAFALGQIRDPRAIDGLTAALKDANASVRQQAAFALGQIR
jgi:HEAT repeat protein/beta-lactamase regulating signal transducer with metallopeptidase domain